MSKNTVYQPSYRDELALSRHFVAVLEQKLAGRDALRRTNMHPLDWCHLGVIGPVRSQRQPVELDAATLEAEAADDPVKDAPDGRVDNVQGEEQSPTKLASFGSTEANDTADKEAGNTGGVTDKVEEREVQRRPPSAIGFEILVEPDDSGFIEVVVSGSLCIFTKHLPSWSEQTNVLDSGASEGAPLAQVVQRWPLALKPVTLHIPAVGGTFNDSGEIDALLTASLQAAFARPDAERQWPGTRPKVSKNDGASEDAYRAFLQSALHGLDIDTGELHGSLEVRATPRPDGKVRLGVYLKNDTLETPPLTKGKGLKDAFKVISDVQVTASLRSGRLHPIEILPVPQDYQYDRRVWAVGHNTSVRVGESATTICTAALAVYEQPRIMTHDAVPAKFSELASNPFQTLDNVFHAMCEYEKDWKDRIIDHNGLGLDAASLAECTRDYEGFLDEIRRFACGIAALKTDERLLRAFQGTNNVFARLANGYDSWRLFQLVYLLTQLPALAIREKHVEGHYPDGVSRNWKDALDWGDVLWFRTGGGKTEAYLGLTCCAILYDRLRGKRFGVTAWLRFPLRMLSIQQLQRAMRMIWEAEKERQEILGSDADTSAPIRLGYFVGSTTTPNGLSAKDLGSLRSEESLEWVRVVPDCPACHAHGSVKVTTDLERIRFRHICSRCNAELPLDVSDDEVYRHLPALIVGTIDKMATVGQQAKYGLLWGAAKWKCPAHGYAFGEYCCAYDCQAPKKGRRKVTPYDPSPALHIQDELHLLQEELGAFAGHYETLIRFCEKSAGSLPAKVIAATATIEGFENQVRHLYGVKNARRFPGRGYDRTRSFYAEPDKDPHGESKTARIFVAFKSPSLSPADASAYCSEIFHAEIGALIDDPAYARTLFRDAQTDDDVYALLRNYTTTLNYASSLPKGSRVKQALEEIGAKVRVGHRDLNVEFHSSRSTSAEVTDVVHRIESPPTWDNDGFLDALVATNMISHGVDLERVNLMTMDGVPEQTAEYIQASSRSGRRHVGIVVVVLANFSLRASSIYHRFMEYHQHLDRMVSPVPVNRFAKYAAQRTLPGVVMGLLYGLHVVRTGDSSLKYRNNASALITQLGAGFLNEVKHAYSLGESVYDARLENALTTVLNRQLGIIELSIRNSMVKNVKDAIRPVPMTSLRDVESGVPFWPEFSDHRLLMFAQKKKD